MREITNEENNVCDPVSCILLSILVIPTVAAGPKFSDVPKTHWAYEAIQTMAEGGLVAGYGGGKFGPNDTITVAQMATIIGNAKGNPAKAGPDGYWAYGNIDYCINTLHCLPDLGAINADNYNQAIPRELSIYMLMKGLGVKNPESKNVSATDIPDYADISNYAQTTVLDAYQNGVIVGKDSKGTFGPKDILTRAQMCTIFYRAGWITAAPKATDGTAPSATELVAAIRSMSGVTWSESTDINNGNTILTANERKYGGLKVAYNTSNHQKVSITLPERVHDLCYDASGNQLDVADNKIPDTNAVDKKWPSPSAYSYEARQLVKSILEIAFPTESGDAYQAFKGVMRGELYETKYSVPAAVRWYDGRLLYLSFNTTGYSNRTIIDGPGEKSYYNSLTKYPVTDSHQGTMFYDGGMAGFAQYELDKW